MIIVDHLRYYECQVCKQVYIEYMVIFILYMMMMIYIEYIDIYY